MSDPTLKSGGNGSHKRLINLLSGGGLGSALMVVQLELEKDPESWAAWDAKAEILYLRKRYPEALECNNRSLDLNSSNSLAWNSKWNALYMLKRYEEALSATIMPSNQTRF